jgi:hypothetical protein
MTARAVDPVEHELVDHQQHEEWATAALVGRACGGMTVTVE